MHATPRNMAEGEIPLLDADRLDDHAGATAKSNGSSGFGDRDDDRALNRMVEKLRRTAVGAKLSDEALQDKAIDLYNSLCDNIRRGTASEAQVAQAAQLFGESPEHLQERLAPKPVNDSDQGANALLAALKG